MDKGIPVAKLGLPTQPEYEIQLKKPFFTFFQNDKVQQ